MLVLILKNIFFVVFYECGRKILCYLPAILVNYLFLIFLSYRTIFLFRHFKKCGKTFFGCVLVSFLILCFPRKIRFEIGRVIYKRLKLFQS